MVVFLMNSLKSKIKNPAKNGAIVKQYRNKITAKLILRKINNAEIEMCKVIFRLKKL